MLYCIAAIVLNKLTLVWGEISVHSKKILFLNVDRNINNLMSTSNRFPTASIFTKCVNVNFCSKIKKLICRKNKILLTVKRRLTRPY